MTTPRAYDSAQLLQKAEAFCAYQERCSAEVIEKLIRLGAQEDDISCLLESLKAQNFLNDSRFIEAYISGKLRIKKWGVQKIKAGLIAKRIERSLIEAPLKELPYQEEYQLILKELAQRKWHELSREKDDWTRQQKLYRFLQARGFRYEDFAALRFD
ncbi:MAG: hypothetical protein RLZZ301_928 [Bacteroidota bacterium]|jgi:regulatory protein